MEGKLSDQLFYITDKHIPTVAEKPIKSLGRWYSATSKDKGQLKPLREDTISDLARIDQTMLVGRLKKWCFQFGVLLQLL